MKNFAFVEPFLKQSLYLLREKRPSYKVFWKNFFFVYRGAPDEQIKKLPRIRRSGREKIKNDRSDYVLVRTVALIV